MSLSFLNYLNELDQITGVSFTSVGHDSLNVDQYDNYFGESFASAQNNNFQEPEIRIVKESSTKNSRKSKDLTEQHKEYEKHNEKLRLYRKKVYDDWKSTLLLRSGMGTFKPIATLIKNQITKRNVLSNIYGLENVLIIFVTNSMCSFAVFDSRKLISREQIVSQSENVAQYTKAKGNYFIASLDNYQNISSSMVKEVFTLGKPISKYVNPIVEDAMNQKYEILETETGRILSLRRKEK